MQSIRAVSCVFSACSMHLTGKFAKNISMINDFASIFGQASATLTVVHFVFQLVAGLGAFLIAVKIMSDTMNQLAGVGLKKLFGRLGNNKLAGVGMGTLTSAVLHSSAITTVMVVGFVNAGVMALTEATTIIMGANIGTTFTALVAALGTSFDFMTYATVLAFVGIFINSLAKSEKGKTVGYMTAGLGLIFVALQFMNSAFDVVKADEQVMTAIKSAIAAVSGDNIGCYLLMVLIGIVLTFLLQSSTALTTILISMADIFCLTNASGYVTGITNGVLFIILGSNIGTCFTTIISSVGANTNAKRAAVIHLLFNATGSLLFFVLLSVWKTFTADTLNVWFVGKPGLQIAVFHTVFNVSCTALFLPFSKVFVLITEKLLSDRAKMDDEKEDTVYIDDRFLPTPSIAVQQSKKEVCHIGDLTIQTCDVAINAFLEGDVSKESDVQSRLRQISVLNKKLVQYLVKVSANATTTEHSEGTISALYYVLGDLMRIGDLSTNVLKYTAKVVSGEITFSQNVYPEVQSMYQKVREMFGVAMQCFLTKDNDLLADVEKREAEVDGIRKSLVTAHIERLNNGECNPASNGVFINLVGNLERMADHITFIAESIKNNPAN